MNISNESEFNRYSIAVRDFERVVEFLTESENQKMSSLVYESLLICAVIYYYRPFSPNEIINDAEASKKIEIETFSDLTDAELELHKKCKEIRNKALAHAEWAKYPTRIDPENNVISSRVYSILNESINWSNLRILTEKICLQCHHRRADFKNQNRP